MGSPHTLLLCAALLAASFTASAYFESRPGCASRGFAAAKVMALTAEGDAVVTGCLHGQDSDRMLTMRYGSLAGDVRWSAQYEGTGSGDDGAAAVAVDATGDVIVAGRSYDGPRSRRNTRVIKYSGQAATPLWNIAFDAGDYSHANAVAVDASGDVVVTGESTDAAGGRNIRTSKFDARSGALRWTASFNGSFSGFDIGWAVAVDAHGDVYVTGTSGETVGGSNLRTLKYDGRSGALLWTHQLGAAGDDTGLDAAIAPDGNLVVVGQSYEANDGQWRIIKYDAGSGAILWTVTMGAAPGLKDWANALAFDAAGNVFVTGASNGETNTNMRTVKLEASTGTTLWSATFEGASGQMDLGYAVAVDAAGDVVVTGSSSEATRFHARTIKYRGSDGRELWSVAGPADSQGLGLGIDANGDVLVASNNFSLRGYGYRVAKYAGADGRVKWLAAPEVNEALPGAITGLWWNPAESGWGIHLTQRRNIVFAAWYTYDAAGNAKWYVASGCALPDAGAPGSCTDTLYEANASAFFGTPRFDPATVHLAAAGTLRLDFQGADAGTMTYTVGGQTRTVPIQRQALPGMPAAIDFSDLWWNPRESGWGLGVAHRGDVMFLAWYVYDAAGRPTWLVASNCAALAVGLGCSGPLYRTTGPAFGPIFDPSRVRVTEVGTVKVSFFDANNGTLQYTVDGVTGSRSIVRQLF